MNVNFLYTKHAKYKRMYTSFAPLHPWIKWLTESARSQRASCGKSKVPLSSRIRDSILRSTACICARRHATRSSGRAGCCWNQRGGVPSTSSPTGEPYAFSRLSALIAIRAGWDSVNWVYIGETRLSESQNTGHHNRSRGRFSNYLTCSAINHEIEKIK